jgi:hypothetical protein
MTLSAHHNIGRIVRTQVRSARLRWLCVCRGWIPNNVLAAADGAAIKDSAGECGGSMTRLRSPSGGRPSRSAAFRDGERESADKPALYRSSYSLVNGAAGMCVRLGRLSTRSTVDAARIQADKGNRAHPIRNHWQADAAHGERASCVSPGQATYPQVLGIARHSCHNSNAVRTENGCLT